MFFFANLETEARDFAVFFWGGSPCFTWNGKLPAFSHVQGREELQKMLEDYSKHRYKSDTQPTEEDKHGTRRDFKMFTEK